MSAVDDASEHWLISKDKLDFGPFNMREVISQIESGKITGEAFITDTETAERKKIQDHPQLRTLVMDSQAKLAEQARVDADDADRRKALRPRWSRCVGVMVVVVFGGAGRRLLVRQDPPLVRARRRSSKRSSTRTSTG